MTTYEPPEPGRTAPIETQATTPPTPDETFAAPPPRLVTPDASVEESAWAAPTSEDVGLRSDMPPAEVEHPSVATAVPVTAVAGTPDVTYVPLAVSIGDGFKFGCGFFLAAVVALLVGFVVFAALFALTSLSGVNLPLGR